MQGTWVWSLVWEDSTCHEAAKPMHYNYWIYTLEPKSLNYWGSKTRTRALQQEKPLQWKACAPQQRVAPTRSKQRKPRAVLKTQHVRAQSLQSCSTLCDPMDCSPPGSSDHGILQARVLEWVSISFSGGSSRTRAWTQVSCIAGRFFTTEPPGKPQDPAQP